MGSKPAGSLPGRLPLVALPTVLTVATAALAVILRTTRARMPAIAMTRPANDVLHFGELLGHGSSSTIERTHRITESGVASPQLRLPPL